MSIEKRAATRRIFETRGGRKLRFTALGFGSAPLGNYLQALSEEQCDDTLTAAWEQDLRYFDTAPLYGLGLSEMRVGRLLTGKRREEFIVSTKVGRILEPCAKEDVNSGFFIDTPQVRFFYDYSYDGVMRSYEASLERIGLDRVEILFVHDLCALVHGGREASEARIQEMLDRGGWRAIAELRDKGDIAAIGIGVNEWQPCARMLELADPDLFLLAGRYTLLEQEPLDTLFPQCAERGVGIVIGGPYNSGVLAGRSTYNYADIPPAISARVRELDTVCRRHGVPLAQAALQFVHAHPLVVSVIPGAQSVAELVQNVTLLDQSTPSGLWQELKDENLVHSDAPTP